MEGAERSVSVAEATRAIAIDALAAGVDLPEIDRKGDGGRPRTPGSGLTQNELSLIKSRSLQSVLDEKDILLGRCDLAFRASAASPPAQHWFAESVACRKVRRGGASLDYGARRGVEQQVVAAAALFRKSAEMADMLFEFMARKFMLTRAPNPLALGAPLPPCKTVADAEHRLKAAVAAPKGHPRQVLNMTERLHFVSFALGRKKAYDEASAAWERIREAVRAHVEERQRSGVCHLRTAVLGEDCVLCIAQFLGHSHVAACMLTGRDLRGVTFFRRQIPHLSIRKVAGMFPHAAEGSTCVVSKKTVSRVMVDLVVCGARRRECPQETLAHKRPEAVPLGREERLAHKSDLHQRARRHAPEEACSEGLFRKRVSHSTCFAEPIACSIDLVYADNHAPVRSSTGESALHVPRFHRGDAAPHTTHVASDNVPYPACLNFYVTLLTSQCNGRTFKLRVQGRTCAKDAQRTPVALETFSDEFAVVSTKRVAQNAAAAAKRARAEARPRIISR